MPVGGPWVLARLNLEETLLRPRTTEVSTRLTVAADDPMAGQHEGQRVRRTGRADRTDRAWVVEPRGYLPVGRGGAIADPVQRPDDLAPEAGGEAEIECELEAGTPPGEEFLDLLRGLVEPAGAAQDARADPAGDVGEDPLLSLGRDEPDADEPRRGRGEDERAERLSMVR